MFRKNREPATAARMTAALNVLRAWPGGVTIGYLRDKVAGGRDELSTALKNLRDEGFAENPSRGCWRMVPDTAPAAPPVVDAPLTFGVAGSYADIHARAIAAEEQLAEEQAENKRMAQTLRECSEAFQRVRYVARKMRKRAQRLDKEQRQVERFLLGLDIKDPTIPF